MTRSLLMLLFATAAAPAAAQSMNTAEPTTCAQPSPLSPEFAAWASPVAADAAKTAHGLSAAEIAVGKAVRATLPDTSNVSYILSPKKPGDPASHGGLFSFTVKEAGVYRVALGSGAWIDMLEDGQEVASTAHGHGPACSDIRKIVDFPLKSGRHVLQLVGSRDAALTLLINRAP